MNAAPDTDGLDRVVVAVLDAMGAAARRDVPLGPLTTYRVGGPAAVLVEVEDDAALARLAAVTAGSGVPTLVIGRGSNLLVADAGFAGVAVHLGSGFASLEIGEDRARAGGAATLPSVARRLAAAGRRGFGWAVGVPGTIGGAVRMNAGGHGSDMAASLVGDRVLDLATGEDGAMAVVDLDLGYRRSALGPTQVVVDATLAVSAGDPEVLAAELEDIVAWRRAHQPGGANAGSVFTNPPGDSAGRLIEAAGGKGRRVGTAVVSDKHANFIQADPGGSADDVHRLMQVVVDLVAEHSGVRLHPETRLVGFDDEVTR